MFTLNDICTIAVQIEKNGQETYLKASEVAKNTEVKDLMLWMANEEKRHARWFSSLESQKKLSVGEQRVERLGREILRDMVKGNDFLQDASRLETSTSIEEVLVQSMEFERETILFYEFIQALLEGEDLVLQLQDIINEEKRHLSKLEEIIKS